MPGWGTGTSGMTGASGAFAGARATGAGGYGNPGFARSPGIGYDGSGGAPRNDISHMAAVRASSAPMQAARRASVADANEGGVGNWLAGLVGLSERAAPLGSMQDRADWTLNPATAVGTIVGMATGIPLLGAIAGWGYDKLGGGNINLGPEVFGGGTSSQLANLAGMGNRGADRGGGKGGSGDWWNSIAGRRVGGGGRWGDGGGDAEDDGGAGGGGQTGYRDYPGDYFTYGYGPQWSFFNPPPYLNLPEPAKKRRGGMVPGPRAARDDMIPARLVPGEYVVPRGKMEKLGKGKPERGASKLEAMLRKVTAKKKAA